MNKTCNCCGIEKSLFDFEHQKGRPSPRKTCKACRYNQRDKTKELVRHREYMKERRTNEPDKVRQNWERSTYGVCKEDFNYSECYLCGSKHKLCIDHCHETRRPRGLLCSSCNFALGHFKDDKSVLEKAIKYLSKDGPHFELGANE